MDLLLEVAVIDHAGQFDQPAQGNLTPAAADFRAPQGIDEVLGLLSQ